MVLGQRQHVHPCSVVMPPLLSMDSVWAVTQLTEAPLGVAHCVMPAKPTGLPEPVPETLYYSFHSLRFFVHFYDLLILHGFGKKMGSTGCRTHCFLDWVYCI